MWFSYFSVLEDMTVTCEITVCVHVAWQAYYLLAWHDMSLAGYVGGNWYVQLHTAHFLYIWSQITIILFWVSTRTDFIWAGEHVWILSHWVCCAPSYRSYLEYSQHLDNIADLRTSVKGVSIHPFIKTLRRRDSHGLLRKWVLVFDVNQNDLNIYAQCVHMLRCLVWLWPNEW